MTASEDQATARSVLVRSEKLYVTPKRVIEGGALLIQDGVIVQIGRGLEAPEGARVIEGRVVCPGFIDAWSSFALEENAFEDDRVGRATRASDALDSYVDPRFEQQILGAGVTAYRVQPSAGARAGGLGAVVRLHPGKRADQSTLLADCCLAGGIALARDGRAVDGFDRVGEIDLWIGALSDGQAYLVE